MIDLFLQLVNLVFLFLTAAPCRSDGESDHRGSHRHFMAAAGILVYFRRVDHIVAERVLPLLELPLVLVHLSFAGRELLFDRAVRRGQVGNLFVEIRDLGL